jgi:adenylate kinase
VIYIEVEEEALLQRLGGRWTCSKCSAVYHETASPPQNAGKCDQCGGELYQRTDDNIQTIKERLKVYFAQTAPLLEYYDVGDKLIRIEGKSGIEAVAENIMDALGTK